VKQKPNFTILFSCILLYTVVLSGCIESTLPTPILAPTLSQTSPPAVTITATPTLNYKTVILTPDDVFSLPGLIEWSTPDSEDFCEHLPPPQVVANPDKFSLLSGRFVLCIYERTFTAMDLDTGSLVSSDAKSGEIVLGSPGGGEKPTYGVFGRNTAYVKDTYHNEAYSAHEGANKISYEYCENALQNQTDQGGMYVGEQFIGDIACVKTTEGQIALLRVEKIYPAVTLSVEFSFAILRSE
jgi:hypothetical protein